jgi:hypothetical protein
VGWKYAIKLKEKEEELKDRAQQNSWVNRFIRKSKK